MREWGNKKVNEKYLFGDITNAQFDKVLASVEDEIDRQATEEFNEFNEEEISDFNEKQPINQIEEEFRTLDKQVLTCFSSI